MPAPVEDLPVPAAPRPDAGPETAAPAPGVLVAGQFRLGADYRVQRSRGTRDWLLTGTSGGAGLFRLEATGWRAEPGDLWLLAPGLPHDYGTDPAVGQWSFSWVHFLPRPAWADWLRWPQVAPGLCHLHLAPGPLRDRTAMAWNRLVLDATGTGALREELALCSLEEILLLAFGQQAGGQARIDARIRATLDHVAQHLAEHHSAATLAARAALSPSRLEHLFKQETGGSLMRAVLGVRLRQAARLLAFTDRTVAQIAGDTGFASPFHFSRRFAAHFGCGPRAYRQRRAGNP